MVFCNIYSLSKKLILIKNVLLVDDDEDEVNIFNEALERAGILCNCLWVESGLQVPYISPLPDMIFLDLNMPRVDGFECLKDIKQTPALITVPVILYSTGMNSDLKKKGLLMGAAACIAKGYSITDLAETLKQIFTLPFAQRASC